MYKNTTPIFIFSLPRSGSTLLQRILNNRDDIDTFAETWLFLPLVSNFYADAVPIHSTATYNAELSQRALREIKKFLPDKNNFIDQQIREFVQGIYDQLSNSKYFIDKTPRYYYLINHIIRIYPDAKFIFLTRNLLSTITSFKKTWYHNTFIKSRDHYDDIIYGPKLLYDAYQSHRDISFHLKYEDLVTHPDKYIKELCQYLDIPFQAIDLDSSGEEVKGKMGDKTGTKKYSKISKKSAATPHINSYSESLVYRKILFNYNDELLEFFNTSLLNKKIILFPGLLFLLDYLCSIAIIKLDIWKYIKQIKHKIKNIKSR